MATVALTKDNFESTVVDNEIVIVDFWASWCGPCRAFAPTFEEASTEHEDVVFAKIDTEDQQELAGAFGIQSIPTLMIFKDKVQVFSQAGALPKAALADLVDQAKALDMDEVRKAMADEGTSTQDPSAQDSAQDAPAVS